MFIVKTRHILSSYWHSIVSFNLLAMNAFILNMFESLRENLKLKERIVMMEIDTNQKLDVPCLIIAISFFILDLWMILSMVFIEFTVGRFFLSIFFSVGTFGFTKPLVESFIENIKNKKKKKSVKTHDSTKNVQDANISTTTEFIGHEEPNETQHKGNPDIIKSPPFAAQSSDSKGKSNSLSDQKTVTVNICDPRSGLSEEDFGEALLGFIEWPSEFLKETWTIGKEISQELYKKFRSPKNGEIFIIVSYDDGKKQTMLVTNDFWDLTMNELHKDNYPLNNPLVKMILIAYVQDLIHRYLPEFEQIEEALIMKGREIFKPIDFSKEYAVYYEHKRR